MNPFVRIKLSADLPIERFRNLLHAVRHHTVIIWDGDEASFWCEKHRQYFEENEACVQCILEMTSQTNQENPMSKIRVSRTSTTATIEKKKSKEWPIVVYIWAFGLALVSYAVARVALDGMPHPYHWASGIVDGLAGIALGWLWFRWRGDIL